MEGRCSAGSRRSEGKQAGAEGLEEWAVGSPRVQNQLDQGELWQVSGTTGGPALRKETRLLVLESVTQRLWVALSGVGCNLSGQTAPWGWGSLGKGGSWELLSASSQQQLAVLAGKGIWGYHTNIPQRFMALLPQLQQKDGRVEDSLYGLKPNGSSPFLEKGDLGASVGKQVQKG